MMKHGACLSAIGLALMGCGEHGSATKVRSHAEALSVGPAIELDPVRLAAPITGGAKLGAVGAGDSGYLAVWCVKNQPGAREGRYATRLSSNGDVLDDPPLKLSDSPCVPSDARSLPSIAHGASGYVVVYPKLLDNDLQATLIADDGAIGATQDVASAMGSQTNPALVSSGSDLLLVWQDNRSGNDDVYAQRLSDQGAAIGNEFLIAGSPTAERYPTVAWDGSNYLVAWDHLSSIEAVHVTPTGSVVESTPSALVTGNTPALSAAGGNVLLAYLSGDDLMARLYDTGGAQLSTLTVAPNVSGAVPRATTSGSDFLLTWRHGVGVEPSEHVHAARVSAGGVLLDTAPGLELGTVGSLPGAASDGSGYLVAWTGDGSGSHDQILAASVPLSGAPQSAQLLMRDLNPQRQPSVAFDSTNHLVVWQSQSATSGFDLLAARVGPSGSVLDAPPLALIAEAGDQTDVRLVRGSASYLLTWIDAASSSLRAARLDAAGALLGTASTIATGARNADIAAGSDGYLASFVYGEDVVAQRVDTDGQALGGRLTFGIGDLFAHPAVAWGGYYLVVWETEQDELVSVRVSVDGVVVDSAPITIATKQELDAFLSFGAPAVAFGGGVFLVVFNELGGPSYAKRIAVDGSVLDSLPVALPDWGRTSHVPSVRFDGSRFVVADGGDQQIGVTYIGLDGSVSSEQATFDAPPSDQVSRTLQLSVECGGDTLAVYSQDIDDTPHERVFARRITPETTGAADCTVPPAIEPSGGSAGTAGGGAGTAGGSGGGSGSGGSGGSGGAAGSSGGDAATGGAGASNSSDASGCGCRVVERQTSAASWAGLLGLCLLFVRRRR